MWIDYVVPASPEKASQIRQEANMLRAEILFSDSDWWLTINGALLPCSISDEVGFDSKEANNLGKHLCPEAELAHHAAGTTQVIRSFQCGSQGPNLTGLSTKDDETHTKEKDKQYFCAYLSVRDRIRNDHSAPTGKHFMFKLREVKYGPHRAGRQWSKRVVRNAVSLTFMWHSSAMLSTSNSPFLPTPIITDTA